MPYLIGMMVALGVALFATRVGLDRDRAFYSTVTIVVASYYVLFATMGGSRHTLILELTVMAGFVTAAVLGFKKSEWILVAALAAHGVFDALRGNVIENPGVPAWWPAFCGTFDVVAAACLAWIIVRRSGAGTRPGHRPAMADDSPSSGQSNMHCVDGHRRSPQIVRWPSA